MGSHRSVWIYAGCLAWLALSSVAVADNTGEHAATQTAAVGSGFSNASEAFVCGGAVAKATANSRTQDYYGYGFADLPATAQITGLAVRVRANDGGSRNRNFGVSLSWNGGTSFTAAVRTPNFKKDASLKDFVLGGAANLWGRASWSAAELADANFRVRVTAAKASTSSPANLDCIPVTIYYDLTGTPSLNVAKTAGPDPVIVGTNLTYTISYSNTGTAAATNVLLRDATPAGTTFVSASPAPISAPAAGSAGTVTWNTGDLAVGASGSVTMVVNVDADLSVGTPVENLDYAVSSDESSPIQGTPVQTATIGVSALGLTSSHSPSPVAPGELLTYTLTLSNPGTADATGVIVEESYDGNVTFESANPAPDAGTTDTWSFATLAPGSVQTITVTVRVAAGLRDGVLLANTASADDDAGDNATAAEQTPVRNVVLLTLGESGAPSPVGPGSTLTYRIDYRNAGTADLSGVKVRQARDAGVAFVEANPAPDAGTTDTWTLASLAAGASGTIVVTTTVSTSLADGTVLHDQSSVEDGDGHSASASTDTPVAASCGDGIVTSPESCDAGAENGSAGSCCTATCQVRDAGQTCRDTAGQCDTADVCDGVSGACPADAKSTSVCRAAADVCDTAESCDGAGNDCPADEFLPGSTLCRVGSGDVCDPSESCSGASAACPADVIASAATTCRAAAGVCDQAETCSGTAGQACPANAFLPASTVCRAGSGDVCDPDERCSGSAASCPVDVVSGPATVCNAGSGDACDPDEYCSGNSGQACPADSVTAAGSVCRSGSGDMCDPDETCTGAPDAACPTDIVAGATTVCRAGVGECGLNGTCSGTPGEQCPADRYAAAGTPCSDDGNVCTNNRCNGAGGCIALVNSNACDDGNFCTVSDTCRAGTCAGVTRDCSDTDACTEDTCDESTDSCVHPPLDCDDGIMCTADSCEPTIGCVYEGVPPVSDCMNAGKTRLTVRDAADDQFDSIKWLWANGAAFNIADVGSPQATTGFSLCLYDDYGSGPELVAAAAVPPGRSWKVSGTAKAQYKDSSAQFDGVRSVKIQTGGAGKTKVSWQAKGANTRPPAATSAQSMFAASPDVTVQMLNDRGSCWASSFASSAFKQNSHDKAKAQAKAY